MAGASAVAGSESWTSAMSGATKMFDTKLRTIGQQQVKYPEPFAQLDEAVVCAQELHENWVGWLMRDWVIEEGAHKGESLALGTVLDYMSALMGCAVRLYKATGADASKLFLTCVDKGADTASARWWHGLRKEVERELFERAKKLGEPMDKSAAPIYLAEVEGICKAYAKMAERWQPDVSAARTALLPPAVLLPTTPRCTCQIWWSFELTPAPRRPTGRLAQALRQDGVRHRWAVL